MSKRNSAEIAFRSLSLTAPSRIPGAVVSPLPWRAGSGRATALGMLLADAIALPVCLLLFLSGASVGTFPLAIAVWIGFRYLADLYEPTMLPPPEEVRRSFFSCIAAAAAHLGVLSLMGEFAAGWLGALLAWATLLLLPWGSRQLARLLLMRARLYGEPVVVVGAGPSSRALINELRHNPEQGLSPVAIFTDDNALRGRLIEGVPVVGRTDEAPGFVFPYPVEHAMIALDAEEALDLRDISERFASRFTHVHVTPDFVGLATLWVRARSIGPLLTLEFRHDRLTPVAVRMKRVFDVVFGAIFLFLAAPIIAAAALAVKLVSPGPAFFTQVREGYRGRLIRVWKIRTMVPDAEQRLHDHLRENSAARREWAERVKLEEDPRVIPGLGNFLRQWSLDELPQLWNVVTGSMSLVGPRPFPDYHLHMFPSGFRELRRQMPPGVTGLWQVTYRADGDLSHQRAADSYYVHNWSVWLDVWILLRTVRVVFSGTGV